MSSPFVSGDRVWVFKDNKQEWWPARVLSYEEVVALGHSWKSDCDFAVGLYTGEEVTDVAGEEGSSRSGLPPKMEILQLHFSRGYVLFFETSSEKAVTSNPFLKQAIRNALSDPTANPLKTDQELLFIDAKASSAAAGSGGSRSTGGVTATGGSSSSTAARHIPQTSSVGGGGVSASTSHPRSSKRRRPEEEISSGGRGEQKTRTSSSTTHPGYASEEGIHTPRRLPTEKLRQLAKSLEGEEDLLLVRRLLAQLDRVDVSREQLETSRIGVAVGNLLGKPSLRPVWPLIKAIISFWARHLPKETLSGIQKIKSSSVVPPAAAAATASMMMMSRGEGPASPVPFLPSLVPTANMALLGSGSPLASSIGQLPHPSTSTSSKSLLMASSALLGGLGGKRGGSENRPANVFPSTTHNADVLAFVSPTTRGEPHLPPPSHPPLVKGLGVSGSQNTNITTATSSSNNNNNNNMSTSLFSSPTTAPRSTGFVHNVSVALESAMPLDKVKDPVAHKSLVDQVARQLSKGVISMEDRQILLSRLRNPELPELREKLLSGEWDAVKYLQQPEDVFVTKSELEAQRKRLEEALDAQENAALSTMNETSLFTCENCGKKRCRYHEQQTRGGDEPSTKFITCLECNLTWTEE